MVLSKKLAVALAIALPVVGLVAGAALAGDVDQAVDADTGSIPEDACTSRPCYDRGGDMEDTNIPGSDEGKAETPQYTDPATLKGSVATFAAGCFWGVEDRFKDVEGVTDTTVGYTGGTVQEPTYKQVCSGSTGHAEAIQIQYDPSVVSYEELLDVFWAIHDPTQLDRQGPDIGTQYRSAIFYHNEEQQQKAEASKARLSESGRYTKPIVTKVEPVGLFWAAEDYHQDYLDKNGPFPW